MNEVFNIINVRNAIANWARFDTTGRPYGKPAQDDWDRDDLDLAFRAEGVVLTENQVITAHRVLERRAFMGGNYMLDARAVVKELEDVEDTK